jgi:hypothetical protein
MFAFSCIPAQIQRVPDGVWWMDGETAMPMTDAVLEDYCLLALDTGLEAREWERLVAHLTHLFESMGLDEQ